MIKNIAFCLSLAIGFFLPVMGFAATDSLEFIIRIEVNADLIDVWVPEYAGFGRGIGFGSTTISAISSGVKNIGDCNIKLTLSAKPNTVLSYAYIDSLASTYWIQNEEKPGGPLVEKEYRLAGIYTNKLREVDVADFNADDVFCQAGRECTSAAYAFDDEVDPDPNPLTNDPDKFRGFNISPETWRDMFFLIEIPEMDDELEEDLKGELLVTITVLAEKQ